MGSPRPQSAASTNAAQRDEACVLVNASLVRVAERELLGALTEQARPVLGMPAYPSTAELAAFDRAVHAICREAHRLDVHAEELVIALKQAWSQLAVLRTSRLGERDSDVLRDVVSASIEVFFESGDGEERRAQ
ncbi:MAG TPA: hypothetical protein VF461_22890 [Gemmatimonadaceae bacterium]